jgi:hypothetical protein
MGTSTAKKRAALPVLQRMVEQFQCPGCVCGSDTSCGRFAPNYEGGTYACGGHVLGTFVLGLGHFALGLPKGFNRPGGVNGKEHHGMAIRLWAAGTQPEWNNFNVPAWALEKGGYLFVRTYAPRVNQTWTDVIESGERAALCPTAIDVGEFYDEID